MPTSTPAVTTLAHSTVATVQPPSPSATVPVPSATPSPSATVVPSPTRVDEQDAFASTYSLWGDSQAEVFPHRAADGKAKVVNSIFFDGPPFFGFDIQTSSGWYHVTGAEHWDMLGGERVSPVVNPLRRPHDGDTVIIYGEVNQRFITAIYIGFSDGTPWYYRSLLQAEELRSGKLPAAYQGLKVWVRGTLSSHASEQPFYTLPNGTTLDADFQGRQAIVAGSLVISDTTQVQVTQGIYVQGPGHSVRIVSATPEPAEQYEQGSIHAIATSGRAITLLRPTGTSIQVHIQETTLIEFADGTTADVTELVLDRSILALGRYSTPEHLWTSQITIVGTTAQRSAFAAYLAGETGDLWSVALPPASQDSTPRQITHLTVPTPDLANAVFSPDGQHFVFAHQNEERSTLVLGDTNTGQMHELLTDDDWQEADPAWSPDGGRIVFARYRLTDQEREDGGLWVLRLSQVKPKQLTGAAAVGRRSVAPRWSPDGRYIAYGIAAWGTRHATLYVWWPPADSRQVLEYTLEWRWYVDSSMLVCTHQAPDEKYSRLWVVQRDGTSPTWMTPTGANDQSCRLAPDGTAIAFLSRLGSSAKPDQLWIAQADGTHRLQPADKPYANRLAWSSDSQSVVFLRVDATAGSDGLWSVSHDGSGLSSLAPNATALVGTYQSN